MDIYTILGSLCVAYTAMELLRLSCAPLAHTGSAQFANFEFGAVDVESGRPVEVCMDRRGRMSRAGSPRRRSADRR